MFDTEDIRFCGVGSMPLGDALDGFPGVNWRPLPGNLRGLLVFACS
jgi:hypothetical protein